jgi:signal transduction histidine kinase
MILTSLAQGPKLDSLKRVLDKERNPDKRIAAISLLLDQLQNPNDRLVYAREAYSLSQNATDESKMIASREMGISMGMLGMLDSCEYYFKQSLDASLRMGNRRNISSAYNGLGNVYRMRGELNEGLTSLLKALEYADEPASRKWRADVLTNIAGVYYELENYKASQKKVLEARKIYLDLADSRNIAYSSNLLAILYRKTKRLDSALYFNREALKILEEVKDTVQIIYNHVNSTEILYEQNKLHDAADVAVKTLELSRRFSERDPEITSLLQLARIYVKLGMISVADRYINQAIAVARQYNFRTKIPEGYELKAMVAAARNNFPEALDFLEKRRMMNDSIRSREIADRMSELSVKYETTQKETEIRRLNAEQDVKDLRLRQARILNTLLTIVAVIGLGVLLTIVYLYRQRIVLHNKLREANEAKDRLFSVVAHDLKNPLSAMKGLANLLDDDLDSIPPDQQKVLISSISKSSNKLFELLQNLLEWSVNQEGGLTYKPERLQAALVAQEAIELFRAGFEAKDIYVENKLPNDLYVEADYKMLFSVFRNLLSNSIKFTGNGGQIKIDSKLQGGMVEISVIDNGVGIAKAKVETLFQKSQNRQSSTGMGLGLILCREFVERNGGTIWAESAIGEGSKFTFTLKVAGISGQ